MYVNAWIPGVGTARTAAWVAKVQNDTSVSEVYEGMKTPKDNVYTANKDAKPDKELTYRLGWSLGIILPPRQIAST